MNRETTTHNPFGTVRAGRAGRTSFRLDRPAADDGAGDPAQLRQDPAESPGLIALILKAIHSEPEDRRRGVRHAADLREVWLGWWSGDDFGAVSGRVRDIGRGGARVVVAVRPPRRDSVWLYKEVDDTLACVRADVVGTTPAPGGLYTVRFRFAAACPTELLQAVVCDPPAPGKQPPGRVIPTKGEVGHP